MDDLRRYIPDSCKVGGCIILKLQHFIKAIDVIFLSNHHLCCYKYTINNIISYCHAKIASFVHFKSKEVRLNSYFTLLFAIKVFRAPTQAIASKHVST